MVGWQGHPRWANTDIFNLLDIDPHTTDLTWEIVNVRPRQIAKKLRPNDSSIMPPDGVSITLINAFRSELFGILYPSIQIDGELHAGDATPRSQKELAESLKQINNAKLDGYRRTWDADNGVPGNWLGVTAAPPAQGPSEAQFHATTRFSDAMNVHVNNDPEGTELNPIPLDVYGTRNDPVVFTGSGDAASAFVNNNDNNNPSLALMPMHQRDKFMQLSTWEATPANFKYVIAPSRLRAMAKKYTDNKAAIVIGVVRRPDWNAAQTFPEYICMASLEGSNSLRIRVKRRSVGGDELPKWPGGGSVYLSLDEIMQQGYLFRPFCNNFNKDRLRAYLQNMAETDGMPRVREMAVAIRSGD